MTKGEYPHPLPLPDKDSQPFWDGLKKHVLLVQRCSKCGRFRWPPRSVCNACWSLESEWFHTSGKGWIRSWIISHHAVLASFAAKVPYNVVLVELVEQDDLRLIGNLVDQPSGESIHQNAVVEAVFDDVIDGTTLLRWRLAEQ